MVISARGYIPLINHRSNDITDYVLNKYNYIDGKNALDYADEKTKQVLLEYSTYNPKIYMPIYDVIFDSVNQNDYQQAKITFLYPGSDYKHDLAYNLSQEELTHNQQLRDLFTFFLEHKVDPNIVLLYAALHGDQELVKLSVEHGAMNYKDAINMIERNTVAEGDIYGISESVAKVLTDYLQNLEYNREILSKLDQTINLSLSVLNSGTRYLTSSEDYIKNYPIEDQNIIRKIIENTEYITDDEFQRPMVNSIQKFINAIDERKFYIILDSVKIGSEHWILHRFWIYLQPIRDNILGFIDSAKPETFIHKELNDKNLVVFDDAAYSGNNTLAKIDMVNYHWKQHNKKLLSVNYHIVIAYMTQFSIDAITNFDPNIKVFVYNSKIMIPFEELHPLTEEFKRKHKIEAIPVPLYFDHKIANQFGSFPQFYTDILANPIDRSSINKVAEYYKL